MDHPVKHQNMQTLADYQRQLCDACGYNWEITVLGGDDSKFCPQCGKEKVRTVEEIGLDFNGKTVLFKREYPEQETEKSDDK